MEWKTVEEYAPTTNGRAERMFGTVKKSIRTYLLNEVLNCVQEVPQIPNGYGRRSIAGDLSHFQLMYGVVPRISSLYTLSSYKSERPRLPLVGVRRHPVLQFWSGQTP